MQVRSFRVLLQVYKYLQVSQLKETSVPFRHIVISIMAWVLLHNVTSTFHSRQEVPRIHDYMICRSRYTSSEFSSVFLAIALSNYPAKVPDSHIRAPGQEPSQNHRRTQLSGRLLAPYHLTP